MFPSLIDVRRIWASIGVWETLDTVAKHLPVHGAVLHTGKILLLSGSGNLPDNLAARLFFSELRQYPALANVLSLQTRSDVFCSGHSFLPDGSLLVAGGTSGLDPDTGAKETYVFDVSSETFAPAGDFENGRFYPALVTMGDGRVVAVAGNREDTTKILDAQGNVVQENPKTNFPIEVFDPTTRQWSSPIPGITTLSTDLTDQGRVVSPEGSGWPDWPLYPHAFLTEHGTILMPGGYVDTGHVLRSDWRPGILDIQDASYVEFDDPSTTTAYWQDDFLLDHRDLASSVLLPPAQDQRVMLIGGGSTIGGDQANPTPAAVADCKILAIQTGAPTTGWITSTDALPCPRMNHNAVILPDRTVLVCGGNVTSPVGEGDVTSNSSPLAVFPCAIYDDLAPPTMKWRAAAPMDLPRLYHSIALLLPDGNVLAGGSQPTDGPSVGELCLSLYSPPYLFKGPRPGAGVAPLVRYADEIKIECDRPEQIRWAHMIRPMATTHAFDTEQRLIDLPILGRDSSAVYTEMTSNPNIAPPGWYMLFVVNTRGIPSEACWVKVPRASRPPIQAVSA